MRKTSRYSSLETEKPDMYGDFALVYDRLMADVDYDSWIEFYHGMLSSSGVPEKGTVLEAACGTGSMTVRLARHYHVLPGDLSLEMLSRAVLKAREYGLDLPFLCQDMRSLEAHRPVDAVVSVCDGVNYLLTEKDLKRFFRSALNVLKPGGALAFDISSAYKLRTVLGNSPRIQKEQDICYFWENRWNGRSQRLLMQLSIFIRRDDGAWDLIEETQSQRAWERETITSALEAAGFDTIRCFGEKGAAPPAQKDCRLHFCANKPKAG